MVSLLLVLSFAFIPVRCDASTAPHSIFVSPTMLNATGGHAHHTGHENRTATVKSVAHHSPLSLDAASAEPGAHEHGPSATDAPTGDQPGSQLGGANDPGSQQPVGATLDLPPTSVIGESSILPLLERTLQLLVFAPISIPGGITTAPDPPPPKLA